MAIWEKTECEIEGERQTEGERKKEREGERKRGRWSRLSLLVAFLVPSVDADTGAGRYWEATYPLLRFSSHLNKPTGERGRSG